MLSPTQFLPIVAALITLVIAPACSAQEYIFSAESKSASSYTAERNRAIYEQLDFDDRSAFERVDRGFIAPLLNDGDIEGVFEATAFNFMQDREAPPEVNPSLWRHAQLANRGGLYRVTDKIYQVRGQDLVNLTIIESDTGVIFYDVEYTAKPLVQSIRLYQKHRGEKPLRGVIISHSHADHFGGFDGIYDAGLATPEDFSSGRIPLIAPANFVEKSVSENVMAGNIMARRAGYQYGNVLRPGERGLVTGALGAAVANGASSLPIPNRYVSDEDGEEITIDGVTFEFFYTPNAEAPSEMVFYIPEWRALSMAEEVNHLQHNIYTLRGAEIRDAQVWASYIGNILARFGKEVEVNFGPHTWPVWGNEDVVEYLKNQRDLYQSIHDTALRYANHGYRPDDIAEYAELPASVFNSWDNRPYYGSTQNNIKSTYIRNLGWYDGNATELARLPDADRGRRYVEALGGADAVIALALEHFRSGDYRFTVDLLNNIVSYTADNERANYLMADAFEQLGYAQENALYRNWYLSSANELRVGGDVPATFNTTSAEVIAGLPPSLLVSYLGMLVDQIAAEAFGNLTMNLVLEDGTSIAVDLHNGVMNSVVGHTDASAELTLTTSRSDLLDFLYGNSTLDAFATTSGTSIDGDTDRLAGLPGIFDLELRNDMNLVLPLQEGSRIR